ncbi:class I SAM-dependent methyltransferase [Bradyrhizobium sp. HKCCYLRH2015]|uniref:class I SAM-dependent methyltransferase n=1 Tax=Bradyrhizobium sp. HKCCYLRH2015 TaxID=3420742 RepID=UPI003EBD7A40
MTDPKAELLWRQFAEARMKEGNLNDHLDLPCVLAEVPVGLGLKALDLGCGLGQSSFMLAEKLGYDVVAVDASVEMLAQARKLYSGSKISWMESTFEALSVAPDSVDLIVACLSFHFVENLEGLLERCFSWLRRGGLLVFSVRHPIRTSNPAGLEGDVIWRVKDYFLEGPREFEWLGVPCRNYHRTMGSYMRMLLRAGFNINNLVEPSDDSSLSKLSAEGRSVPFFLTISCRKPSP